MYPDGPPDCVTTTRRRLLAVGTATVLTATAGCTAVPDFMATQFFDFGEVNVINSTDRTIDVEVTVRGPAGETALDRAVALSPSDSDSIATFADVWGEPGDYDVGVELTDVAVDGVSRASETVTIANSEEEMLAILLGADSTDTPIGFRVGESFSELVEE